MKQKQRPTNYKIVSDLMTVSPYGAIAQVFVLEAIRAFSEHVCNQPRPEVTEEELSQVLIDPRIWWNVAKDINTKIEKTFAKEDVNEATGDLS